MGKRLRLNSERGFAAVLLALIALLAISFGVCVWSYDEYSDAGFGLSREIALHIVGAYTPIVGAAFVAFRAALFRNLGRRSRTLPGAGIMYCWCLVGIVFAFGGLFLVASGTSIEKAKWTIAAAATLWAATIGYVIQKFFSEHETNANR